MKIKIILILSLVSCSKLFALTEFNANYQPPPSINVDDYPTISVNLDSSKTAVDCKLDSLSKVYVCDGNTLVKDSGYGAFIALNLSKDHSSKVTNPTKVTSGDKVLSDISSYGTWGSSAPVDLSQKDLSAKIASQLMSIDGFLGLRKDLQGKTPERILGSSEYEKIVKEHLENKSQYEALLKTVFTESNYQVELDNGKKVSCNRGTTRDLNSNEKNFEQRSGVKFQCGSFKCDNVTIDGKEYDAVMMYESSPQAMGSTSFHLIDKDGLGPEVKIRKIQSAGSKLPLIDNSYFIDNPNFATMGGYNMSMGMSMNGQQGEVFPDPLPKNFKKDILLFKNPYFQQAMSHYWSICGNDNGALAALENAKDIELEKLANAELAQFIAVLADGRLFGQFIDPNDAANIGCFYDGVYLNKGAAKNLDRIKKNINPDENVDKTISHTRATELFNKARKMDDIAWDYKPDGCYARAHLMARRFEAEGVRVDKVWIKGNLSVPEAGVNWNFHVAPIVYVEENGKTTKMVIDPSLFDKPVTVEEWDKKMTKNTKRGSVITAFPFPENAALMERSALAFSSSDPYLPGDNIDMGEEGKMEMANQTMFQYKNIDPNNGIYNYPGMPQQ